MCVLLLFPFLHSTYLIKIQDPRRHFPAQCHPIRDKFKIMFDGYRKMFDHSLSKKKMFDHSLSKSQDLGDMLRFLPGVVVQKRVSMQGMVDLYRIKPDLLEPLIKSIFIEPLLVRSSHTPYLLCFILDGYLSGFLQDRDRSQHYFCDPMLQHISICRHILSLLDKSNAFGLQSYVFLISYAPIFLNLTF